MRRHHLFLVLIGAVAIVRAARLALVAGSAAAGGRTHPPRTNTSRARRCRSARSSCSTAASATSSAEGSIEGDARVDLQLPGQRCQRLAQKPRPARPRQRQGHDHQLRRPGTHRPHTQNLRPRPDRQSDVRPAAQPGARRENRGDAAKRQRHRHQHADRHHRRHGIADRSRISARYTCSICCATKACAACR